MRFRTVHPSPALVVALVALVAALAGTAVAGNDGGPTATTAAKKVGKKQVKKIARKQANRRITQRAPGLNVNSARTAETAGSAGSAANADSAAVAAVAGDAETVNGRTASCPAGTTAVSGLCFDSTARGPADWPTATSGCAAAGRWLPSVGQLVAAAAALGNVASGSGEWTDSFWVDNGTTNLALGVNDTGAATALNLVANRPYRCVVPLVR